MVHSRTPLQWCRDKIKVIWPRTSCPASDPTSPAPSQTSPSPQSPRLGSPQPPLPSIPLEPSLTPVSSLLFPKFLILPHGAAVPRTVYLSLSSDLRLRHAVPGVAPPSSLLDFRGPDFKFPLNRIPLDPSNPSASLSALVAPYIGRVNHVAGPSVRITRNAKTVYLIASSRSERSALLAALRLRVAPLALLRARMESEMRGRPSSSASSSSSISPATLSDAARNFLSAAGAHAGGDDDESSTAGFASMLWERTGSVAEISLWSAAFGQGLGGVVRNAEELEELAKPLGGLTVLGCAFSLVALSARMVKLMAIEREGRQSLAKAQDDLREASLSLVKWLFNIVGSGYEDDDKLVRGVFDVLVESWESIEKLEQYLLRCWAVRAWNAEEVGLIVAKADSVRGKLLAAGLLKVVVVGEKKVDALKAKVAEIVSRVGDMGDQVSAVEDRVGAVEDRASEMQNLRDQLASVSGQVSALKESHALIQSAQSKLIDQLQRQVEALEEGARVAPDIFYAAMKGIPRPAAVPLVLPPSR